MFGFWAFTSRQDYKSNVDQKIAAAGEQIRLTTSSAKDKEFTEKEKNPLKHYLGPSTYGSVDIQYPKTWSAFVTQSTDTNQPLDGYFYPDVVPGIQSGSAFALRLKIVNQAYDQEIKQLSALVKNGKVKVAPFRLAKLPNILGSRADGEITVGQKDSKVYLPLRDKTLEVWTESDQFVDDFTKIILPNLTFSP
ncbi:hypothetical protein HY218_02415 [Candidatus Saccharibacteria bacterium]|nr:hypothetical protein [Candidatus Saccharibacteria bacterium]